MQVARKSGSSIGPLNLHSSTLDATAERQRERERDGETSEHPPSAYWFPTVTVLAGGVLGGRVDKLRWERAFLSTPKGATLTARLADRCGGRPSGQGSFGRGPKPLSKQASTALAPYLKQSKERGERGFLEPAGTVVEVLDPAAVLADVPQVKVVSVKLLDPEGK